MLLKKVFNVGFDHISVVDRRAVSLDDLGRYPLFSADFIGFLRDAVPARRHGEVVQAVVVTACKPAQARPANECPSCRHRNALDARFCNQCGGQLAQAGVGEDAALPSGFDVHALLDAGSGGCEEGALLKLREVLRGLERGQVLEVRSTDPGVREDLPAWCRLTGQEYLGSTGPRYFVRKS